MASSTMKRPPLLNEYPEGLCSTAGAIEHR